MRESEVVVPGEGRHDDLVLVHGILADRAFPGVIAEDHAVTRVDGAVPVRNPERGGSSFRVDRRRRDRFPAAIFNLQGDLGRILADRRHDRVQFEDVLAERVHREHDRPEFALGERV